MTLKPHTFLLSFQPDKLIAQSTLPQCNGPLTVSSQDDADSISSCDNFIGNVVIDPSVSGSLELNGMRMISGDLTVANVTALTSLSADTLNQILGSFDLTDLTSLSTLHFPALVAPRLLRLSGLPSLQALGFTTGVSQVDLVSVIDTQLNDLSGLELTYAGEIDISNNPYLTTIRFNDLTNLTDSLNVGFNGGNLSLALPNLESAASIRLRNVSNIDLASLSNTDSALTIYSSSMESLAFPALSTVGDTVTVFDCPNLNGLRMDALTVVGGGLTLENNNRLSGFTFPKLKTIVGDIRLSGTFDQYNFPGLSEIRGDAVVETPSSNHTICDDFQKAKDAGFIKGLVTCKTGQSGASGNSSSSPTRSSDVPSSTASGGPASTTTPSSSGGSNPDDVAPNKSKPSSGLIAGAVIGVIVAIALAALAFWYFCVKRKRQRQPKPPSRGAPHPKDPELPQGGHHEKTELPADPNHVSELHGDRQHLRDTRQAKEVAGVSVIPSNSTDPSSTVSSEEARERAVHGTATITHPSELAWDQYEPRHELHGSEVPELRGEKTL